MILTAFAGYFIIVLIIALFYMLFYFGMSMFLPKRIGFKIYSIYFVTTFAALIMSFFVLYLIFGEPFINALLIFAEYSGK